MIFEKTRQSQSAVENVERVITRSVYIRSSNVSKYIGAYFLFSEDIPGYSKVSYKALELSNIVWDLELFVF
jgi:hypothetical protein